MKQTYKTKIILWITLCIMELTNLKAGHIIGGEIVYSCIADEQYRFRLSLYRDCGCNNCAALDAANIAVYRCGGNQACEELNQSTVFQTIEVLVSELNGIIQPDASCMLSPPFVCVEEGVYEFILNLPYSTTETYHIVYQRCCRNETINNILNPSDSGATFSIVIPPEAQSSCNRSPVFNDFPPTLLCVNELLQFDHSAFDADGDSLVYEFCNPLLGGSTNNNGSCNGVEPIPPCPPPFMPVHFIEPLYSVDSPISGSPAFSIHPLSGLISGVPNLQGQFVVGVCVSEYRDGVFLGAVKRDFQFNVTTCENIVDAKIEADEQISYNTYQLNVCGDTIVTIQNISTLEVFIENWEWEFEWDGQLHQFEDWSPTVVFPATNRTYTGRLLLNPDTPCGDTAFVHIRIFPPISASFNWEQDSCLDAAITFNNLSIPNNLNSFWSFGDGNTSSLNQPQHLFQEPNIFPVSLIVEDTTGCRDTSLQNVSYFPLPDNIALKQSMTHACVDQNIVFSNLSAPITEAYDIEWNFGDGSNMKGENVIHAYTDAGTYTILLSVVNPFGCRMDSIFENSIIIEAYPLADFSFQPQEISSLTPEVYFENQSEGANNWTWSFGEESVSFVQNPSFIFPDTGYYEVQLIATTLASCSDTITQYLYVEPEVAYFLPNAFSPNHDGINDVFVGTGQLQHLSDFQISIWNRWGALVFYSNKPEEGWNGQQFNTSVLAPSGVYIYRASYSNPQNKTIELKGFVSLIR